MFVSTLFALACVSSSNAFTTTLPLAFQRNAAAVTTATHHSPLHMSVTTKNVDEFELPDDIPEEHRRNNPKNQQHQDNNNNEEEGNQRSRQVQSEQQQSNFVQGEALHALRRKVLALRTELRDAQAAKDEQSVLELRRAIIHAQQMDAEFVYAVNTEKMNSVEEANGSPEEVEEYRMEAMKARQAMPQFNLEGLWVGK